MFGALKSKGFNFEESKIAGKEKVNKLMAFLSISFLCSILAGQYRREQSPIALKKSPNLKTCPIKSLFKHGLEWLKNVLVNSRLKKKEFSVLPRLFSKSFAKIHRLYPSIVVE